MFCSGDDRFGYEKASERWLPIHTVETILISGDFISHFCIFLLFICFFCFCSPAHDKLAVISMLADPNDESPANVDAAKEWRDSYPEFK